jgi:hypothetical protein
MSEHDDSRSNTQRWFRNYSEGLANSFRSSALIVHNPTKGGTREQQVISLLKGLLPRCCEVQSNTVVHDANDGQSAKFDGVILNRWTWPLLLAEDDLVVAPVESVLVALETKSALDRDEIADVCSKCRSLRGLTYPGRSSRPPKAAVFAYTCTNPHLAFLDYAVTAHRNAANSADVICILGSGVMALGQEQGNTITFTERSPGKPFPAFIRCGADALLLYFFLISHWVIADSNGSSEFVRYVTAAFSRADVFYFDPDFLDSLAGNSDRLEAAREVFKRRGTTDIDTLYQEARRAVAGRGKATEAGPSAAAEWGRM